MKKLACGSLVLIAILSLVAVMPQAFAWERERPGGNLTLAERAENATTDGKGEVGIGVDVGSYREDTPDTPSDGNDDLVTLKIVATANTRNNTYYVCSESNYYLWVDDSSLSDAISLGDDEIRLVSFAPPHNVRFYGGPASGEYNAIWICSNGWLSFYDPQRPTAPPAMPYCGAFPSTSGINNFVAPFWRDLKPNPSGYMTVRYGWIDHWPGYGYNRHSFVISWNARDKYGNSQIFQAFLEMAPGYEVGQMPWMNSLIWFQYKSITLTDTTVVGVENQAGSRCASYSYSNLHNEVALQFSDSLGYYAGVKYLQIRMVENDPNAWATLDTTPALTRGRNVNLEQNLPKEDPSEGYLLAASGAATVCMTVWTLKTLAKPALLCTGVGILVDCAFVGIDLYSYLARQQAAGALLDWDPENAPTTATATAEGPVEGGLPVDASLCLTAYWVFTDQNTANHSLTVGAILWYENFDSDGYPISLTGISATVQLELKRDNNNNSGTAAILQSGIKLFKQYIGGYDASDFYKIYVPQGYKIDILADHNGNYSTCMYVYLYDPNMGSRANTGYGQHESLTYTSDSQTGWWYIEVRKYGTTYGFYDLVACVYYSDGGGGGCPTLYVRDGSGTTGFYCEGLLDIHNPDGIDIVNNHTLACTPMWTCGTYALRLTEHPQTYSHIDQVKLYATLESDVTIQLPLICAWHSEYGNVLPQLMFSDDWKTETIGSDHNNGVCQSIDLYFLALPPSIGVKAYTFQIEGNNPIGKT